MIMNHHLDYQEQQDIQTSQIDQKDQFDQSHYQDQNNIQDSHNNSNQKQSKLRSSHLLLKQNQSDIYSNFYIKNNSLLYSSPENVCNTQRKHLNKFGIKKFRNRQTDKENDIQLMNLSQVMKNNQRKCQKRIVNKYDLGNEKNIQEHKFTKGLIQDSQNFQQKSKYYSNEENQYFSPQNQKVQNSIIQNSIQINSIGKFKPKVNMNPSIQTKSINDSQVKSNLINSNKIIQNQSFNSYNQSHQNLQNDQNESKKYVYSIKANQISLNRQSMLSKIQEPSVGSIFQYQNQSSYCISKICSLLNETINNLPLSQINLQGNFESLKNDKTYSMTLKLRDFIDYSKIYHSEQQQSFSKNSSLLVQNNNKTQNPSNNKSLFQQMLEINNQLQSKKIPAFSKKVNSFDEIFNIMLKLHEIQQDNQTFIKQAIKQKFASLYLKNNKNLKFQITLQTSKNNNLSIEQNMLQKQDDEQIDPDDQWSSKYITSRRDVNSPFLSKQLLKQKSISNLENNSKQMKTKSNSIFIIKQGQLDFIKEYLQIYEFLIVQILKKIINLSDKGIRNKSVDTYKFPKITKNHKLKFQQLIKTRIFNSHTNFYQILNETCNKFVYFLNQLDFQQSKTSHLLQFFNKNISQIFQNTNLKSQFGQNLILQICQLCVDQQQELFFLIFLLYLIQSQVQNEISQNIQTSRLRNQDQRQLKSKRNDNKSAKNYKKSNFSQKQCNQQLQTKQPLKTIRNKTTAYIQTNRYDQKTKQKTIMSNQNQQQQNQSEQQQRQNLKNINNQQKDNNQMIMKRSNLSSKHKAQGSKQENIKINLRNNNQFAKKQMRFQTNPSSLKMMIKIKQNNLNIIDSFSKRYPNQQNIQFTTTSNQKKPKSTSSFFNILNKDPVTHQKHLQNLHFQKQLKQKTNQLQKNHQIIKKLIIYHQLNQIQKQIQQQNKKIIYQSKLTDLKSRFEYKIQEQDHQINSMRQQLYLRQLNQQKINEQRKLQIKLLEQNNQINMLKRYKLGQQEVNRMRKKYKNLVDIKKGCYKQIKSMLRNKKQLKLL